VERLKKILEDHCLEKGKKGLLLLGMPTGSGKTHAVLDFIYEHYREFAERKSKIFFVTNLKKNLPDDALAERFRRNGEIAELRGMSSGFRRLPIMSSGRFRGLRAKDAYRMSSGRKPFQSCSKPCCNSMKCGATFVRREEST